jgi:hypothetical protein
MAGKLRRLGFLERIDGGVQNQDGPTDRTHAWRLDKCLRYAVTLITINRGITDCYLGRSQAVASPCPVPAPKHSSATPVVRPA